MDFTSLKNNPLYGPLRIVVVAALAFAIHKGWIPANVIDPDLATAILVGAMVTWSIWQQNHSAKQADLVTAVAVHRTVASQTPASTPLSPAQQKAIAVAAKVTVQLLPAKEITDALNASHPQPK